MFLDSEAFRHIEMEDLVCISSICRMVAMEKGTEDSVRLTDLIGLHIFGVGVHVYQEVGGKTIAYFGRKGSPQIDTEFEDLEKLFDNNGPYAYGPQE